MSKKPANNTAEIDLEMIDQLARTFAIALLRGGKAIVVEPLNPVQGLSHGFTVRLDPGRR